MEYQLDKVKNLRILSKEEEEYIHKMYPVFMKEGMIEWGHMPDKNLAKMCLSYTFLALNNCQIIKPKLKEFEVIQIWEFYKSVYSAIKDEFNLYFKPQEVTVNEK